MKKSILCVIGIILIISICRYVYFFNKTETVLLSGKVFGLDIQNIEQEHKNKYGELLPTSLKKIGTITFINKDNNFAALGHPISEIDYNKMSLGKCYDICLDEIEKAEMNNSGKIVAALNENQRIGEFRNSNNYGVFGKLYESKDDLIEIDTSNRYSINIGKAEIYIDLEGNG